MRAIVDDRRRPLARAGFSEVDAQPIASAQNEVRAYTFCAQRADGGIANRVCRHARYVEAVDAELREAHRDIGFAATECGGQRRRLKQSFEARRTEPEHDLAERDDRHSRPERADATFATRRCAPVVMTSNRRSAMARASSNADPMPTATAPARIQSPALSMDTPPVGISFNCGSGARMSLKYVGPSAVAGNTLTTSAPAFQASK